MLAGAVANITIPLKVKNRRIGVLHVCNKRNGEFTEQDLEILTFLASHLATSIENAILYERERKQAEELAQLNAKMRNHQQELEALIRNHNLLLRRVIKSDIYVQNGKEQYRLVSPIGDARMILGYMSLENAYGVIYYDQLGVYSLLFEINDSILLREFVEARLGPLLDYDGKKDSSLVVTLEKYLKCRGSIKETANLLYVHGSTVKYRLARIRELLTLDLDNNENHFNLQLALYALRIIEKGRYDTVSSKANNFTHQSLRETTQTSYA